MSEVTTDEYFGGCPECGKNDGYLNVERVHVCLCDEHQVFWRIGENLFSSWQDETEEDWKQNEEKLRGYREVKPIYAPAPQPTETGNQFLDDFLP